MWSCCWWDGRLAPDQVYWHIEGGPVALAVQLLERRKQRVDAARQQRLVSIEVLHRRLQLVHLPEGTSRRHAGQCAVALTESFTMHVQRVWTLRSPPSELSDSNMQLTALQAVQAHLR